VSLRNYKLLIGFDLVISLTFDPLASQIVLALIFMMHHVSAMLENCEYVRYLMIDFSRTFVLTLLIM